VTTEGWSCCCMRSGTRRSSPAREGGCRGMSCRQRIS
jgi:hypothetical protein